MKEIIYNFFVGLFVGSLLVLRIIFRIMVVMTLLLYLYTTLDYISIFWKIIMISSGLLFIITGSF